MTPRQYRSAKRDLGLSHPAMGRLIGRTSRNSFKYAALDRRRDVPDEVGRIVRELLRLQLTKSNERFEEIKAEVEKIPSSLDRVIYLSGQR